jgi:hypothetical protein
VSFPGPTRLLGTVSEQHLALLEEWLLMRREGLPGRSGVGWGGVRNSPNAWLHLG